MCEPIISNRCTNGLAASCGASMKSKSAKKSTQFCIRSSKTAEAVTYIVYMARTRASSRFGARCLASTSLVEPILMRVRSTSVEMFYA